jgi:YD repeat-containing protein
MDGPFGFGWTFSYRLSVSRQANGDLLVTWGDGRRDLFTLDAGNYTPVNPGIFVTLTETNTDVRLTTPEQIDFVFGRPGGLETTFLQRIEDPNGNALTFGYDAQQQLTEITDASGRTVTLTYDANGRVTTITDANASPTRTLHYGYDAAGNQISFTDAL